VTQEHPVSERARLLSEGRAAWEQLSALLDARAELAQVHSSGPAWTSRDVFAHLARWQVRSIDRLTKRMAGNPPLAPLPGTDDEINAGWHAADQALSLPAARTWCLETAEALRSLLLALTPEQWEDFGRDLAVNASAVHYDEHLGFLREA